MSHDAAGREGFFYRWRWNSSFLSFPFFIISRVHHFKISLCYWHLTTRRLCFFELIHFIFISALQLQAPMIREPRQIQIDSTFFVLFYSSVIFFFSLRPLEPSTLASSFSVMVFPVIDEKIIWCLWHNTTVSWWMR